MRTLFQTLMISSVIGLAAIGPSAPALAAALNLPTNGERALPLREAIVITDQNSDRDRVFTPRALSAPINLLAPRVECAASESTKVCDVRTAAAQRAIEVVAGENAVNQSATRVSISPFGLLIPAGMTPVSAVACPPRITVEECVRLNGLMSGTPPGPIEPVIPSPPVVPMPPAPDLGVVPPTGVIPPLQTVPEAVTPPIAADPESVIKPPPTGDDELVKRPPPTASQMPVVKPRANPPVIQ
jgi:invasion protein IalB